MTHMNKAIPVRYYGTAVCLGVGKDIWTIAPLAKDLKDAGNRIVSILGVNVESDLLWEAAIRLVSDKVIISALYGSRGEPLHMGHPLLERLSQGDVNLVVAIGPMEKVERLKSIVEAQACMFVALPVEHQFVETDDLLS